MGGKTKQRTKNNVRPSSSGRSALLLNNVKLETGVMNIAGTELPALFPTLAAPNIDPLVSPELQMCLKKLNKKDPITKTKALQELSELVLNSKVEDVVATLPSWAHFYRLLTSDPDRKVREVTQSCHGSIVSTCGRRVAPHLKALVPAWLQAQYDEHAPAQTHALASLTKTFPDNKLPEVISFCKNEIVSHLVDNLTGTSESNFSKKTDTPEEKELQLIRILSSSLHGLQYTVQHMPPEHEHWLWERIESMLRANLFWKRATHTDIRIRAAWYALLGRIIERYKVQFPAPHGQRALRILIGAKETSPLAAAQLWDAVLLFIYNIEDWTKYLDKPDLLGKRILDVLESGGWGDARHLSNILLPLVAHLPPALLTKEYYVSFFNAIFNGLDKKTILSSKSERQSWITSLDECLRYLSIQPHDFVLEIVSSVHRKWLETILSDTHDGQIRTNLIKYSAASMAALVKYWLKQAKEGPSEKYDQLIRNFWQNVGSTITTQVDKLSTDHSDIAKLIDGHILLLQTLKTSFNQEIKKQQSIKFDGDTPTVVEKPKDPPQCDASIIQRYNHNFDGLVQKICGHYFEFASKKQISSPVLTPLITLLIDFDTPELFMGVARQFDCDSVYRLYDKVLRTWLTGDTMRCKAVIDIVFLMMKHLTETEQDAMFDSFKQFPPSVVEWCMSLSLSHPHRSSACARRWLRSSVVEATVSAICRRVVDTGDSKAKNLLLMCLNHDAGGEMIVSWGAVQATLEQLCAAVRAEPSPALEAVAAVAARLCCELSAPALRPLALALLDLNVRVQRGSSQLSLETWCEVLAAWQDTFAALPADQRRLALRDAADVLHTHAQLDVKSMDLKQIEHVISLCPYLLSTNSELDVKEIVEFTRIILDVTPIDPTTVETFVLRHNIVKSQINCPFEDNHVTKFITEDYKGKIKEMTKENLVSYINYCLFKTTYLKTILLHKVDEDLEDTWCNDLLADDYFVTEFCGVLHDFMVICAASDCYTFWPHYNSIKEGKSRLDSLICDITIECTPQIKTHILNVLSESAATKGYYWSFTRKWFEGLAKSNRDDLQFKCCYIQDTVENEGVQENVEVQVTSDKETDETQNAEDSKAKSEQNKESTESSQEKKDTEHENKQSEEENAKSESDNVEMSDLENIQEIVTGSGYFHSLQANEHWSHGESTLRSKYLVMLRSFYSAHSREPEVVGADFVRDVTAGQPDCDADVIINAYYKHNHVMLYEKDVTESPWSQVVSNAAVAEYLAELVAARGWRLPAHHWDFATITLCNLLTSAVLARQAWGSTKVALLTRSVLNLYLEVEKFISSVKDECTRQQPSAHVAHLPHEWADIFAPDLTVSVFTLVMYFLESSTKVSVCSNHAAVLDVLIRCTRRADWESIPAARRTGAFSLPRVVGGATAALAGPAHYCFKYLAHELLGIMLKPMVLHDAGLLAEWSAEGETGEEEKEKSPPEFSLSLYDEAYFKLQGLVETAVAHVELCEETCELEEFTDVHGLALGWFLLAESMGRHCRLARGDLPHHYIQKYREKKYAVPLLTCALRLLPSAVLSPALAPSPPPAQPRHAQMFNSLPAMDVYRTCTGRTVSAAACRALYWCACGAGVGEVRGWRGAAPHRHARLLDYLVQAYISPTTVKEELSLVQQRAAELEDTEITIIWSSYELTATLTVDSRPVELQTTLARTHPLGLPQLTSENSPAGNTNWLIMFMGYQNGSLLNAIKMWTAAVTRRVERAAQCYICYCRLHHATGRLPNTTCRQCRNKFHFACLRKWFIKSHKSNCPLCRAAF